MLEFPELLVHGWVRRESAEGPVWVRDVVGADGQLLGFVRFDGVPGSSWFSWLRRVRLDVFETDDASHLMSMTRMWGILTGWDIEDAEQRHVGNLYPKTIVSSENERLAYVDSAGDGSGRILDLSGTPLASYVAHGPITKLTFEAPSMTNPFLRMLILAAGLSMAPIPEAP